MPSLASVRRSALIVLVLSAAVLAAVTYTTLTEIGPPIASDVLYRGDRSAADALRARTAEARALASGDIDGNGTPDVVAGYASGGTGIITIQRGNPEAFAPTDDSIYGRMREGHNPDSLLAGADVYAVPAPADFVAVGAFQRGYAKSILFAQKGGGLYYLPNDGNGQFGSAMPIALTGTVTALGTGEFRAPDGIKDVAVGISGPEGPSLVIFDGALGWQQPVARYSLSAPAQAIEFEGLDNDPFVDVAVAAGEELLIVHGWGRKAAVTGLDALERIPMGSSIEEIATGHFTWDRAARKEIAVSAADGTIRILERSDIDVRPLADAEEATRGRARLRTGRAGARNVDVESLPAWQPTDGIRWDAGKTLSAGARGSGVRIVTLRRGYGEVDQISVFAGGGSNVEFIDPANDASSLSITSESGSPGEIGLEGQPVAMVELPRKGNGFRDTVVLTAGRADLAVIPEAPSATIVVDRLDDPAGAALGPASACTAAGNDCSLRGAVQFANANPGTAITLGANTYTLNINGSGGCVIEPQATGNTIGDLEINQNTTITGAGSLQTIVRQTGTGNATYPGDRVFCLNVPLAANKEYTFTGFTITGGRDASGIGGGGIIGGDLDNKLTLVDVRISNNQMTGNSVPGGGGGLVITGGDLTITNSTIGGTNPPCTPFPCNAQRGDVTLGNSSVTNSGAGIGFTPSSPGHTGGTGDLVVTGTIISRNTSFGASGGGGADLYTFAFGSPGGIGSGTTSFATTTFSNNSSASVAGAIALESIGSTVATTTFSNNSASNLGGAIYLGGGNGLTLDGTNPTISFAGNTATNGGSAIGVNVGIDQNVMTNVRTISPTGGVQLMGTNTTFTSTQDVFLAMSGAWTNQPGSSLTFGNLIQDSGGNSCGGCANALMAAFKVNNTTTNISGNWTINGGTFVGDSGTVNVAGNLNYSLAAGHGAFNAGTSTVNFNGGGSQSISNSASITFNNLTDSNVTQPLVANNSFAVNGSLNVNGPNAVFAPVAAAVIGGSGTLTGTGTARVTRTAATPDFLSQYPIPNKTLANLTVDYAGAGNQTVNSAPAYGHMRISESGTKTLQGNVSITGDLTIAAAALDASASNFSFNIGRNWTNSVGAAGFVPRNGTVTFNGTGVVQSLSGNTTFYNLTLNNNSSSTLFGSTTTTIQNNLLANNGSMQGDTSTIVFTGAAGSIGGTSLKRFHNLQINAGATISNSAGGDILIFNDYQNNGTFTQSPGLTTTFVNGPDSTHAFSGAGTTTFGIVNIQTSNTVNAGAHNFSVAGPTFTVGGTFTQTTGTTTFNGAAPQTITGDGSKSFGGLTINNANGVIVAAGAAVPAASVAGTLTLTTDLSLNNGVIIQQSGTSAGAGDVLGKVRRTDLAGGTARPFGNLNNTIQINSGTAPAQMDVDLLKLPPQGMPVGTAVIPRTYTLTPTGGSGILSTVKLRYIDPAELVSGIIESKLILWKNIGGTWTAQGGTVDAANNFVSLSGVSSFSEWAIAEGADLTSSKSNNVSNAAVVGQQWTWFVEVNNPGGAAANFTNGQTILSDALPNSPNITYGTPIAGNANATCAIDANKDLTCTAGALGVTIPEGGNFSVPVPATATVPGTYQNPRAGGSVQADPGNLIVESNDANNTASSNTVTVSKANTTTGVASSQNASVFGQQVTFTAAVSVTAPGSGTPTGTVDFLDGGNPIAGCQDIPVSAGSAQCSTSALSVSNHTISAAYSGDTNFNLSNGNMTGNPQVVNPAATTLSLVSSSNPSAAGASVTFTATVSVTPPGAGEPGGTVQFLDGGNPIAGCNAQSLTGGQAQCSTTALTVGDHTITAVYSGDASFTSSNAGLANNPQVVTATAINVNDGIVIEPTSGTRDLVFTVSLAQAAAGTVSVNFQINDGSATSGSCGVSGDYTDTSGTLTFFAGERVRVISVPVCSDGAGEANETITVVLDTPTGGAAIGDGTATGTITETNIPGTVLISELRTSGPGGAGDDFVEVYNNSSSDLTVTAPDGSAGYGLFKMGADCDAQPVLIGTIPNGTIIPARGSYLLVGSAYSLANYGGTGAAVGNLTLTSDIENDRNIAVFSTSNIAAISTVNRLDAVGFGLNVTGMCNLLREATTLNPTSGDTSEHTFVRNSCMFLGHICSTGGVPADTNVSLDDFRFANTTGTLVGGMRLLGAPGPQTITSPTFRPGGSPSMTLFDTGAAASSVPNVEQSSVPVANGAQGTLRLRRTFTNTGTAAITRLRFRVVEITTFPPAPNRSDLRVLSSSDEPAVATGTGPKPTSGTTLELPPSQPLGGGLNSSVSVNLGGPLGVGATLNFNMLFGIQGGVDPNSFAMAPFRVCIVAETVPTSSPQDQPMCFSTIPASTTAAGVTVAGRVVTPDGRGVTNANVTLNGPDGMTRSVTTGRGGAFTFADVPTGSTYTVAVTSRRFTFQPRIVTVTDQVTGLDFIAGR